MAERQDEGSRVAFMAGENSGKLNSGKIMTFKGKKTFDHVGHSTSFFYFLTRGAH